MHIKCAFKTVIFLTGIITITYVATIHLSEQQFYVMSNGTADNFTTYSTKNTATNVFLEEQHKHVMEAAQVEKAVNKFTNSAGIFPKRSPEKIENRLKIAKDILAPVSEELGRIRKVLLLSNDTWVSPKKPSTVLGSDSSSFLAELTERSEDVLYNENKNASTDTTTRIRTIAIWGEQEKVKAFFPSSFFMDYTTSDCKYVETHSIYGHNMGKSMYNASCHDSIEKAWQFKPFQYSHFNIGLPPNVPYVTNTTHIMLGYIHVIRNGVVDTKGDAAVGNVKIMIRRCQMAKNKGIGHPEASKLYDEVFTIAQHWGSGFFHATVEDLTRIGPHLDFLRANTNVRIHVVAKNGFMKRFMEHLGISSSRLVSGNVGARILYIPAGTQCGRPAIFPTYMLSLEFRNKISTQPEDRKSILIIKRTVKRCFRKHSKIYSMLQTVVGERLELGLRVEVYPDNPVPSLKDTLAMLNRAFIVIAPHGAGESNLLFSEPGTVMIEGLCKSGGKANYCYRNLASVLGHRYYGIYHQHSCYTATPEVIKTPLQQIMNFYLK